MCGSRGCTSPVVRHRLGQASERIMGNETFGDKPAEAVGNRGKPPGSGHRGESPVIEMNEPLTGRIAVYGYKVIECKVMDRCLALTGQPAAEIL